MKRILSAIVGVVALFGAGLVPAGAKVPVSVIGAGPTLTITCSSSCENVGKRNVVLATAQNKGLLAVEGVTQGLVNCVRSATFAGRKGVVIGATSMSAPSSHQLYVAINEGGGSVKPWALVFHFPKSVSGGECGGHLTAGQVANGDPGTGYVPANRYVVVGG